VCEAIRPLLRDMTLTFGNVSLGVPTLPALITGENDTRSHRAILGACSALALCRPSVG
jgi:hypothetical protein